MPRYRLDIAYDGSSFSGWAIQPGLRTVQGELENWLGRILPSAEPITLVVAGRTDAGVHARGQVAHFDLSDSTTGKGLDCDDLARRLTRVLPDDVRVNAVLVAPDGFDARFAAMWRRYCYRIWDPASIPDPLLRRMVTTINEPLNVDAMQAAANTLLGLHDFAPFCKFREGATTIRTLLRFDIHRADDAPRTIEATLVADAFCRSMVRSLMGAVVHVGTGRRDLTWLAGTAALTARASEVTVLPPHGLTLEEVGYPDDADLAARVLQARARRDECCCDEQEDRDSVAPSGTRERPETPHSESEPAS
ncbi:MAG: tRNA pseudouridine(38-40) synthase TruA [Propionibacteriaceae bacterium]|jgi:tRNA pseudouridine38-40 synthase|nr:tRNA pseudouridine(38-40) synthase TruA [Propionibacteriaceae bacterium]